jgi:hypothetical protein
VASVAQTETGSKNKLGIGLEFGLPLGDFGDVYSIGFGGAGKFERSVSKSFAVTVTAGYTSLYYKKDVIDADPQGFIPVKAGGKYYFGAAQNIYLEGEVGASIGTGDGAETVFAYAPGVGISFPVSNKSAIDAGIRYESWNYDVKALNQVGIRVAYKFGL